METLMVVLVLATLFLVTGKSHAEAPVAPVAMPMMMSGHAFVRTVTVTVDDPSELADAIDRVRHANTGNFFAPNYTLGIPFITPDGLTANVPLFQPISA